jgi:hypothetical protein
VTLASTGHHTASDAGPADDAGCPCDPATEFTLYNDYGGPEPAECFPIPASCASQPTCMCIEDASGNNGQECSKTACGVAISLLN